MCQERTKMPKPEPQIEDPTFEERMYPGWKDENLPPQHRGILADLQYNREHTIALLAWSEETGFGSMHPRPKVPRGRPVSPDLPKMAKAKPVAQETT